ncbi:MAG: hypothetical protein QGD92_13690 [Gammaproteobacteria bacterium]|nr:hypothetical protein [Gammaproteobacteria bacterium]
MNSGEIAIEVKGKIRRGDLTPMRAFIKEFKPKHAIIVSNEEVARIVDDIHILPWREFLNAFWSGEYI